jgi:hypothetical protein
MDQPNVNAKASTPESKNSVSSCRSAMGFASDQRIQPRFGNRAVALDINVDSVSSVRRLAIEGHAKSRGSSSRPLQVINCQQKI